MQSHRRTKTSQFLLLLIVVHLLQTCQMKNFPEKFGIMTNFSLCNLLSSSGKKLLMLHFSSFGLFHHFLQCSGIAFCSRLCSFVEISSGSLKRRSERSKKLKSEISPKFLDLDALFPAGVHLQFAKIGFIRAKDRSRRRQRHVVTCQFLYHFFPAALLRLRTDARNVSTFPHRRQPSSLVVL